MSIIPGDDLLDMALDAIDPQDEVFLRRFATATPNDKGQFTLTYEPDVEITASVQAVNRNTYKDLGLDRAKRYITVYSSEYIHTVSRDQHGDLILFGGRLFRAQSDLDWKGIDGWNGVVCVEIPETRQTVSGGVYG